MFKMNLKIVFIFLFLIVIVFVWNRNYNNHSSENFIVKEDLGEEKSFNELLLVFEKNYKASLVYTRRGDYQLAHKSSQESLLVWETIYTNFKNTSLEEYENTLNWSKNLELIYETSIRSDKLISENKLYEANKELDNIRRTLRGMRRENGIENLNDQMLDFYDSFLPIILAEDKDETIKYMQNMKLEFLRLKELNFGKERSLGIKRIEESISGIDKLIASDFREAQKSLLVNFEDLYLITE